MIKAFWSDHEPRVVPVQALLLSILAFSVPVLGITLAPDWAMGEQGNLLWLSALIPPFLFTYYRGWEGASLGLAAGMAALVVTHVGILLLEMSGPNYSSILWIVSAYVVVCLGSGLLGELFRRERRIAQEYALTDRLTGLPNHLHAAVFLEAAFSGAARGQPISVVLFSLDQFDPIGERFGIETAEQVLRRFGAILTELTRRMDLSARWSGQEFVSILSRCKAGGAAAFTTRVMEELRADIFPWGKVTASAGIAEFENGMGSLELLLAAADRALSASKRAGGDRHIIAGTRAEVFSDREEPRSPSTQRGSLRLERLPKGGFQLVPALGVSYSGETWLGATQHEESLPRGHERVLVVNDDPSERSHISKAMKRLGYDVYQVSDGEGALVAAGVSTGFDLLVVDLIMPGMSGFTLVDFIQERFGLQRVLYLTGHLHSEVTWRGAPGALVSFVSKPVNPTEVALTARQLLESSVEEEQPASVLT